MGENESVSVRRRKSLGDSVYMCRELNRASIEHYDPLKLSLVEQVYPPSDDSYMLAEETCSLLIDEKPHTILEIGSGSGYVTLYIVYKLKNKSNPYAIMVDISPCAVASSLTSAKLNELDSYIDVVQCKSATCIRSRSIDVILFNPPYLPVREGSTWIELSWSGGRDGIEVWMEFFSEALRICRDICKVFFVFSTLQNVFKIVDAVLKHCESIEILNCRYFFYEALCTALARCRERA